MAKVEIDEMLRLVRDIAAEVSADYAMPRWVVFLVEFFLDICRNVLLDVVLLERLGCTVDSILLHIFGHVSILDHSLPVGHFGFFWGKVDETRK